jgi:transketolase
MVQECLAAAQALARDGIGATVVDVHTLKPFPGTALAELVGSHRCVVTVEEHTVEGGLGTMTVEALAAAGVRVPVHKHGLRDEFALVGPPTHLYRYNGLDPEGVATVARRMHARENRAPLVAEPLWTAEDRAAVYGRLGVRM